MTSEVVVMNCLAVALAADSAATVTTGGDNKIFNSADKLFMLSKHHPVGVMIYSNSSLLGVPWETILKMFRRELGPKEFPRLQDYGDELLKFLAHNTSLFPPDVQDHFYLKLVEAMFRRLAGGIEDHLYKEVIQNENDPTVDEKRAIARKHILEARDAWSGKKDVSCYDKSIGEAIANRHSGRISDLIAQVFVDLALDADASTALRQLAIMMVSKDEILREARSGIVIAGFGHDDHFPVMQSFELGEIYQNCLKYRCLDPVSITVTRPAFVMPFAHAEMITTFLFGINPTFEGRLLQEVKTLITGLPLDAVDGISDLSDEQKTHWKEKMRPFSAEVAESFLKQLTDYRIGQHLNPIYRAIAHLPKDQLAHVAASLVNLNSFQKRISLKPETVGGPIDVAVISKGDGFIWIDRKHYFKPELNHHFFRNYYADAKKSGAHNGDTAQEEANVREAGGRDDG